MAFSRGIRDRPAGTFVEFPVSDEIVGGKRVHHRRARAAPFEILHLRVLGRPLPKRRDHRIGHAEPLLRREEPDRLDARRGELRKRHGNPRPSRRLLRPHVLRVFGFEPEDRQLDRRGGGLVGHLRRERERLETAPSDVNPAAILGVGQRAEGEIDPGVLRRGLEVPLRDPAGVDLRLRVLPEEEMARRPEVGGREEILLPDLGGEVRDGRPVPPHEAGRGEVGQERSVFLERVERCAGAKRRLCGLGEFPARLRLARRRPGSEFRRVRRIPREPLGNRGKVRLRPLRVAFEETDERGDGSVRLGTFSRAGPEDLRERAGGDFAELDRRRPFSPPDLETERAAPLDGAFDLLRFPRRVRDPWATSRRADTPPAPSRPPSSRAPRLPRPSTRRRRAGPRGPPSSPDRSRGRARHAMSRRPDRSSESESPRARRPAAGAAERWAPGAESRTARRILTMSPR